MSAAAFVRSASRARVAPFARRAFVQQKPVFQRAAFSSGASRLASADVDAHDPHHEESFEEFTARYADPVSFSREEVVEDAMGEGERRLSCSKEKAHTCSLAPQAMCRIA